MFEHITTVLMSLYVSSDRPFKSSFKSYYICQAKVNCRWPTDQLSDGRHLKNTTCVTKTYSYFAFLIYILVPIVKL